ncbi:unnamed protein product [Cuscuta campestris]|uniref:Bulb-type lectin domain-containing protein n=1 Tax=Cuscuta campestris TaxID=132261 RepID=A0A484KZM5_9ASTE|nr:unnamed protein product [Cuscuta campestris]
MPSCSCCTCNHLPASAAVHRRLHHAPNALLHHAPAVPSHARWVPPAARYPNAGVAALAETQHLLVAAATSAAALVLAIAAVRRNARTLLFLRVLSAPAAANAAANAAAAVFRSPARELYLSIWYKSDNKKPCWLANQGRPLKSNSGVLLITGNGTLKIDSSGDLIELYSCQSEAKVSAVLLDNGNFVLTEDGDCRFKSEMEKRHQRKGIAG